MRYHAVKDTHLPWKNNKESYTAGVSIYTDKPIPQSKATYNAPNFSNNFPNPNSSPSPVVPSTQLSCIPDIQNKQKWYLLQQVVYQTSTADESRTIKSEYWQDRYNYIHLDTSYIYKELYKERYADPENPFHEKPS